MAKDKMTEIQEKLDSLKAMGNALFENRPVNKKILGQNILLHVRNIEILLSGNSSGGNILNMFFLKTRCEKAYKSA